MSVKSMFDFKFPASAQQEGFELAQAIGNDMPPLDGYLGHEIIRDVADPGHLMVNTHWRSQAQAAAVLATYQNDTKIKRATELISSAPGGFVGEVVLSSP